jgi:energy-coupling factor transport system permease protein
MAFIDDITLGRYIPQESILHRLDPRVKLMGLPLFVIASFSGQSATRLAGLALLAGVFILLAKIELKVWWRGIRVFRWLFLFTLLLHLFFTPGKTLWGIGWLSQDGLLRGFQVCSQLVLAVIYSSLLTLTTTPHELAGAFSCMLVPLRRFGFPVQDATMLLLLVLHFIPILREEAVDLLNRCRDEGKDPSRGPLLKRARLLRQMVAPLLLKLVDRADALALAAASGEDILGKSTELKPFRQIGPGGFATLFTWILCLVILFGIL